MNGWDLFTWCMVVLLSAGAVVIFIFFLRDIRSIVDGGPDGGSPS